MQRAANLLATLTFDRLATAIFFIVVATVACLMPIQSDTWWQLRAGQEFWQTGSVPLEETYSHTANGSFWMNHEWLSEAIFGSSHKCVQDFGRSQPNGARIRLGCGVWDPVAQGVTVADPTAACAGPALGGGLLGGSFSNRTVLIRKHLREVSVRACWDSA